MKRYIALGFIGLVVGILYQIYLSAQPQCNIQDKLSSIDRQLKLLIDLDHQQEQLDKKLFLQDFFCEEDYKHDVNTVEYKYSEIKNTLESILELRNALNYLYRPVIDVWAQSNYHESHNSTIGIRLRDFTNKLLNLEIKKSEQDLQQKIKELLNEQVNPEIFRINKALPDKQPFVDDYINQNDQQRSEESFQDSVEFKCSIGNTYLGEIKSFANHPNFKLYKALNILQLLKTTLQKQQQLSNIFNQHFNSLYTLLDEIHEYCALYPVSNDNIQYIVHQAQIYQSFITRRIDHLRDQKFKLAQKTLDEISQTKQSEPKN